MWFSNDFVTGTVAVHAHITIFIVAFLDLNLGLIYFKKALET